MPQVVGARLEILINKSSLVPIPMLVKELRALLALSVEPRSVRQLAEAIGAAYTAVADASFRRVEGAFVGV